MKYGLLFLLLITSAIHAQVYRSVDKNGNVVFTDVASDNSEEVIIDIAPSYNPPPTVPLAVEDSDVENSTDVKTPLYKVSITSPTHNESIQNPETVSATVSIEPKLNAIRADKLLFKLDGKNVGKAQTSETISLPRLDRGSHILVVSVVDKAGKVLTRSKSILFHIHRASVAQ
ncbi:MAG: DUF4124 domain-containing protein [Gammaproteobacteria bacterium]|nr:DUF4124 domain-containing protein [Gammaproteobacteria bacterium]